LKSYVKAWRMIWAVPELGWFDSSNLTLEGKQMTQQEIRTKYNDLTTKINNLMAEVRSLQSSCKHPNYIEYSHRDFWEKTCRDCCLVWDNVYNTIDEPD
jgi:hypothetical protein